MQPNQQMRNNPWGFQAMNWSRLVTRGPLSQQARPDMNRFGSPPGPRNMRPDFSQYGQHPGPQTPSSSFCQPRLQNNQGMSFNGPQNQNPFQQGPRQQWHQGPQNNQNAFFRGPGNIGPRHNGSPRPNNNIGQINNRQMVGPPPDFFRAPGGCQVRPRFQPGRQNVEKKKKVNKRDLPENNKFYCDACDRGYKDEDKFILHCNQHEKCPKAGCTYIAAGKLVQLHIKLQHNSGMAKKIWSLESKEDIQKWIEERKRNFPTTANIEKKKALLAERIARGEVIEEKYFGKMHRREDNRRNGRDRGRGRGGSKGDRQQQNLKRKHDDTEKGECSTEKQSKESVEEHTVMQEAAETLGMFFAAASSGSDTSDSDDNVSSYTVKQLTGGSTSTLPNVTAAGALGSLISSYVDSDESEGEEISKKNDSNVNQETLKEKDKLESPGDREKQNNNDVNNKKPQRNRNRGRQKKNKDKWNPSPKIDKSLLEKLLAKEIRQERNKIMQCVHYIVKNNFFEKEKNAENKC